MYVSLKPPPTPAPFLFTETVASSNPHEAATLREVADESRRKDSSWLTSRMMSYAIVYVANKAGSTQLSNTIANVPRQSQWVNFGLPVPTSSVHENVYYYSLPTCLDI